MNIKAVIIWSLAIVVFAALGVFGYFNQDLLVSEPDAYVPSSGEDDKTKACSKVVGNGASVYKFEFDETTKEIKKVIMTYTATSLDLEAFTSASNISLATENGAINGVNSTLSGGSADFVLMVQVDVKAYDKVMTDNLVDDFRKVSMVLESITDYQDYIKAINSAIGGENNYKCD